MNLDLILTPDIKPAIINLLPNPNRRSYDVSKRLGVKRGPYNIPFRYIKRGPNICTQDRRLEAHRINSILLGCGLTTQREISYRDIIIVNCNKDKSSKYIDFS